MGVTAERWGVPAQGDAVRATAELWVGDASAPRRVVAVGSKEALGRFGLAPGQSLTVDQLERVFRGVHADSGARVRSLADVVRSTLGVEADGSGPVRGVVNLRCVVEPGPDAAREVASAGPERQGEIDSALLAGAVAGFEEIVAGKDGRFGVAAIATVREVERAGGETGRAVEAMVLGADRGKDRLYSPVPPGARVPTSKLDAASNAADTALRGELARLVAADRAPEATAVAPAPAPPERAPEPSVAPAPPERAPEPSAAPAPPAAAGLERRVRFLQRHLAAKPEKFVRVELLIRESLAKGVYESDPDEAAAKVAALRREHERRGLEPLVAALDALEGYAGLLGGGPVDKVKAMAREANERIESRAGDREWLVDRREVLGDPFKALADAQAAMKVDTELGRKKLNQWFDTGGALAAARCLAVDHRLRQWERAQEKANAEKATQERTGERREAIEPSGNTSADAGYGG